MKVIIAGPFLLVAVQAVPINNQLSPVEIVAKAQIAAQCRYILILDPISGTILQTPDIGFFPISGHCDIPDIGIPDIGYDPISCIPISVYTQHRVSRYRDIPDIGIYRYLDMPDIMIVYPEIGT